MSALGAALASIGVPEKSIVEYETDVKNGKLLLTVQGNSKEEARACEVLA